MKSTLPDVHEFLSQRTLAIAGVSRSGKKMGKTEGNIVNVMAPAAWKYEALCSWPDSAVSVGALSVSTSRPLMAAIRMVPNIGRAP